MKSHPGKGVQAVADVMPAAHSHFLSFCTFGLCLALATPALAQTPPDTGGLLRDMQREHREAAAPAESPALIEESAPRPAIRLPDGVTIDVSRFRVTGNKSIASDRLSALVQAWEGKTLDVNGLNEAAGAITRHYQTHGFLLAYAYLPVQKIEQGVIEIAVLEGTVDSVQIVTAQDVRLNDEVIQQHIAGIADAKQVMQTDLERRLLLLNDIPGVVARAAFTPGARPGTADVVVTVAEEEPLANSLDFNNYGSDSTGEYRLGAQFHFKNLFGYGDSTRFRLQASQKGQLVNGSLNTRVPIGGKGWSAEAGVSRLTYELGEPYATLGARGEANVVHLGADYAYQRSMQANLNFNLGYDYKDLRDILEFVSDNQKESHQISLGLNANSRDGWLGGGLSLSQLQLAVGTLNWNSAAPAGAATGRFRKLSFDASRRQVLVANWSINARINGQYAFDNLDSSEKLSLAGPYGVRAYAPGEASVDRGSLLSLEVRHAWPLTGGTLSASIFHDYARGQIDVDPAPAATGNTVSLWGSGLGLNWSNGSDLDLSLTAAWRDSRAPTTGDDRKPYIYFQMNQGF